MACASQLGLLGSVLQVLDHFVHLVMLSDRVARQIHARILLHQGNIEMAFFGHRVHGQLLLELREQSVAFGAVALVGDQFLRQFALDIVADA